MPLMLCCYTQGRTPRRKVAITTPETRYLLDCCRGLVVVGSPKTLSSDAIWRSWVRWVRDHGAFQTANTLPLCSWESPDDEFVSELDVSDLRPIEEQGTGMTTAAMPLIPSHQSF